MRPELEVAELPDPPPAQPRRMHLGWSLPWCRISRDSMSLRAMPGVAAAGVLSYVPIRESPPQGLLNLDGDMSKGVTAKYVVASGGALRALDIPLLRGRLFDAQDGPGTGMVAVVSESFARRVWLGQDPIGKEVNGGGHGLVLRGDGPHVRAGGWGCR